MVSEGDRAARAGEEFTVPCDRAGGFAAGGAHQREDQGEEARIAIGGFLGGIGNAGGDESEHVDSSLERLGRFRDGLRVCCNAI